MAPTSHKELRMAPSSHKEFRILFVVLASSVEVRFQSLEGRIENKDFFGRNEILDCQKRTYSQDPFWQGPFLS